MRKKVLISEHQLSALVEYIKENEDQIIIREELLEEGIKAWVLGAALALGLNIGNAQEKGDIILQNDSIRNQIEKTLQNDEGIEDLASELRVDADQLKSYMVKNAEQINNTFDNYDKKKNLNINVKQGDKKYSIKAMLNKFKLNGYAITNIETIYDTIVNYPEAPVVMSDTLSLMIPSIEKHDTFNHKLPTETVENIQNLLKTIKESGGNVTSITIRSKTDAERVPSYISDDDPTGNYTLAKKRAEEAIKAIKGSGIDLGGVSMQIDDSSAVNSGLNQDSKELKIAQDEFNKDRSGSREKYSDDRGVDIVINYEYNSKKADDSNPEVIVEKIVNISYVKAYVYKKTSNKYKGGGSITFNKDKCKVKIGKIDTLKCPTW